MEAPTPTPTPWLLSDNLPRPSKGAPRGECALVPRILRVPEQVQSSLCPHGKPVQSGAVITPAPGSSPAAPSLLHTPRRPRSMGVWRMGQGVGTWYRCEQQGKGLLLHLPADPPLKRRRSRHGQRVGMFTTASPHRRRSCPLSFPVAARGGLSRPSLISACWPRPWWTPCCQR
jgi:hypothetical protein